MSPMTAAAVARELEIPGQRALDRMIDAEADGLRPGLIVQLKLVCADYKRLGATDHHVTHALKALIEEIREARR